MAKPPKSPKPPKPPKPAAPGRPRRAPGKAGAAPARPALDAFHGPVRRWFSATLGEPTPVQSLGWAPIAAGRSALLLAPTGSGKTLAAFLAAVDRLMFSPEPPKKERLRVLYVSPLKALAVDVERNLRAPVAGIAAAAEREGVPFRIPAVGIRSGDTPAAERVRMAKAPPDVLITTPESLFLLLTSEARGMLASVETVIVDEIHTMCGSKRGAHLFLSLERLEELRPSGAPALQRIGLSATQRPLEEVARLLGGLEPGAPSSPRPVEIVDAGTKKAWEIRVEVPVPDMSRLGEEEDLPSGPTSAGPKRTSIWPSIHPRLLELVRAHRSTMIFVNSRRLAERLAAALNELAGEELALAHHGSVAKERRAYIEERLKLGLLPAIVATSSLELGIDIGAVDLVVQIESPPSVASGIQRVGRGGHSVGATSKGVVIPKFRGDLLACAAVARRMEAGEVEPLYYPRNPLDVLAQQVVAIASLGPVSESGLFDLVRRAAPFAELPRASFEGVLDMLSGRYPSDEFAELRPRIVWDRVAGLVRGRDGARRIAVANGGTIPDRGAFGVFLAGEDGAKGRRVGELDEEMVYESHAGDVFLLGASSWRIAEITHDRVVVAPAPGEPGKMPFWHGDRVGRAPELGRAIGALAREIAAEVSAGRQAAAEARLRLAHGLDEFAARNLVAYLADQLEATGEVPTDRTIVVERFVDEIGDWRVCILSPFGARVHAPWATAIAARARSEEGREVETVWGDDGIVLRLPESEKAPDVSALLPAPDEVEELVVRGLAQTSLFAARFRENAGRALLLPRRRPGQRTPLWAQRKRASDLLAVASRYASFPILLETYRECLRDVFDLPATVDLLRRVSARQVRVAVKDTRAPSPFSASLLFSYVANFIYEGDAPLAERRAHALSVDPVQLRELLGAAELRELLDGGALVALEAELQRLDPSRRRPASSADGIHDLLLSLGDLSEGEIRARAAPGLDVPALLELLAAERRVFQATVGGERRYCAAEDAGKLRDALGVVPPRGLPSAFLEPVPRALSELCARYARTHGPFFPEDVARRLGLGVAPVRAALEPLLSAGRLVAGEFTPGRRGRELCDVEVLRALKRRSLAKLRREVEPVEAPVFARFLAGWQGTLAPKRGLEALLGVIEQLQGAPLVASVLERDILPSRVEGYRPGDLDALSAAGEVVWTGLEPLGPSDGRIALFLTDELPLLAPAPRPAEGELLARLRELFAARGALFFADIVAATGAFGGDLQAALWDMVWAGELTNDTFAPLRSLLRTSGGARERRGLSGFRSRRLGPPGTEGRWALVARQVLRRPSETERRAAFARRLLERHGVLTREAVLAEGAAGGFSAVYEVLKAMEDAGRARRGYFVAGLGAAQFALPGAEDRLRAEREPSAPPRPLLLAATDPASPYGAALSWPERAEGAPGQRPQRAAGALVVLFGGELLAYLGRAERGLLTFTASEEPARSEQLQVIARALAGLVRSGRRRSLLLAEVDGAPADRSPLARALAEAGFVATSRGLFLRGQALGLSEARASHA